MHADKLPPSVLVERFCIIMLLLGGWKSYEVGIYFYIIEVKE